MFEDLDFHADRPKDVAPILYFPHGAGPMPLLGEPNHRKMVDFLSAFAGQIRKPAAIVIISAHWEEERVTINDSSKPGLLYDYHGFPERAYRIEYPTCGSASLAKRLIDILNAAGIENDQLTNRGWDHGVFVPLKIMYPLGDVPCVQLSLETSLDPAKHIAIGRAIAKLRQDNILILGSGSSFHNMSLVSGVTPTDREKSVCFDNWLKESVLVGNSDPQVAADRLVNWKSAPSARFSHPREEHLIPLHVCLGAALESVAEASIPYEEYFMGVKVSAFRWD